MFLRALELRGFKSFADRTILEFAPGVSVIVGPNGSGKSNLVDAISWVLGEQGPRAMRGGQMADVIFAGSPQRPALGMAEVKLVIDNTAGKIPVGLSEIEISRTIFRSGESEYRIGGQLVRLLDVQELLSESGIGRALHTVVGQGQLEDILQARPEDRRTYIEEAAGIAKHRRRKERSERKLASLEQDLLRLQDVLAELRRQLKPLKQQAEMAKRHEDLTGEADTVAVRLAAARLRALLTERDRRRGGWDEGVAQRDAARETLERLDDEVTTAGDERARTVWAAQQADDALAAAQEARSTAEADLRTAVASESEARQRLAAESVSGARLATLEDEIRRVREALATAERDALTAATELEEAERRYREAEGARRDADEQRRRSLEETAARRAEFETIRASLAASDRERDRLLETLDEARSRRLSAEEERDRVLADSEGLDGASAPLAERRAELRSERESLSGEIATLEERRAVAEARRDVAAARLAELDDTAGARFIAKHPGRAVGLLGSMVTVEAGWEKALAVALGAYADAVVYADGGEAVADAAGGGGAILARGSGGPSSVVVEGERAFLGMVKAEGPARGIVTALLRDIYVATTLADAAERSRRNPRVSFVTREGVLVGPVAVHTSSDRDARAGALRADRDIAERDAEAARNSLTNAIRRLADVDVELERIEATLADHDGRIARGAERLAVLAADIAAATREQEMLEQRLSGMEEAAVGWRERLASGPPPAAEMPTLPAEVEAPVAARVAVQTAQRDATAYRQRLDVLEAERADLGAQDAASLAAAVERAAAARLDAEHALSAAEEQVRSLAAARAAASDAQRAATETEAEVNRRWREASQELDRLREAYEEEDRARADLERRIRDGERLIREGHDRDPAEVLAELGEDDTIATLERKAELVQRRLQLLGRVNLLASGEFEALQERHDFLNRELDDVRRARRDLLEVIRRIEDEISQTFDAAYRDVAAEFERLFAELFPGGEGRLVATEPGDLLNTGIEIEARPGRKRVKRISLLSGGERALTAMAFLFAIFRSRPSPFYLMDEVEPALDDVNLHRFLKLVEGFAADAQVLIVTHQKRTMEISSMMYGVSMNKDGTTKVVSQTMDAMGAGSPAPTPSPAAAS